MEQLRADPIYDEVNRQFGDESKESARARSANTCGTTAKSNTITVTQRDRLSLLALGIAPLELIPHLDGSGSPLSLEVAKLRKQMTALHLCSGTPEGFLRKVASMPAPLASSVLCSESPCAATRLSLCCATAEDQGGE